MAELPAAVEELGADAHHRIGPGAGVALDRGPEAVTLAAGKGDECAAGIFEAGLVLAREQGEGGLAWLVLGTDDGEVLLGVAFGLQPALLAAAAILAVEPLADDPLQPHCAGAGQQLGAGALERRTELDARRRIVIADQVAKHRAALAERKVPQILAVELDQVEGVEHHALRLATERGLERGEVRAALFVL